MQRLKYEQVSSDVSSVLTCHCHSANDWNAITIFCFTSFPHLLGKTEEECSFHTLKALFPSRKWATEDTPIMLPSSNADDMGTFSVWYTTGIILTTFLLCYSAF